MCLPLKLLTRWRWIRFLLGRWLMERRVLMRFPALWEAVMATRVLDDEWQTPEFTLVSHINHTLMNTFREQRVVGGFPGELDSPVTENHIEHVTVPVDGGRRGRRVRHAHRHRPARVCHRGHHERSDTYRCGRARSSSLCDLCLRDTFRAALTELINGLSPTCG